MCVYNPFSVIHLLLSVWSSSHFWFRSFDFHAHLHSGTRQSAVAVSASLSENLPNVHARRTPWECEIAVQWRTVGEGGRSGVKIRRGTIKGGEGSALSAFARRTVDKITLRARYVCGHCYQRGPREGQVKTLAHRWGFETELKHRGRHLALLTYGDSASVTISRGRLRIFPSMHLSLSPD